MNEYQENENEYQENDKCRGCGVGLWALGESNGGHMAWQPAHNEANCLASRLDERTKERDALSEALRTYDDLLPCDCCGSYSAETADDDGEGNPLGHTQCAQCSRIAELEEKVRDRDEIINGTAEEYAKIVKEQGSRLDETTNDLAREREAYAAVYAGLRDPAMVWANMLRGEIARPAALEHYEECTTKLEAAESRLSAFLDRCGEHDYCKFCDQYNPHWPRYARKHDPDCPVGLARAAAVERQKS